MIGLTHRHITEEADVHLTARQEDFRVGVDDLIEDTHRTGDKYAKQI